jgi:hypothetical protein
LIRDGVDTGYLRITEQVTDHANNKGIEIDIQSHVEGEVKTDTQPAAPSPAMVPGRTVVPTAAAPTTPLAAPTHPPRLDRVAKLFVTFDRMHEDWSIVTTSDDGRLGPATVTELGNSDKEVERVLDAAAAKNHEVGDQFDPRNPKTVEREHYTLSVSTYAKVRTGVPVNRQLPVFYLPAALGQLLPRLLPLDSERTYMFATYVNDQREVMSRYIDVQREQNAVLDGRPTRAVPVLDRIGVQGSATTHYVTRDGQWLGSVNEDQKIVVLPSDETELKQIWKTDKLTLASVEQQTKDR